MWAMLARGVTLDAGGDVVSSAIDVVTFETRWVDGRRRRILGGSLRVIGDCVAGREASLGIAEIAQFLVARRRTRGARGVHQRAVGLTVGAAFPSAQGPRRFAVQERLALREVRLAYPALDAVHVSVARGPRGQPLA